MAQGPKSRSLVRLLGFASVILFVATMGQAAAPTLSTPTITLNVRDFGATGDGKTKDTAAIQQAIDRAYVFGGGEVVVPPGNYLTGAIALRSNTTLHLEKDATLVGTPDFADYPITQVRWEGKWIQNPLRHPALIEPIGCNGVRFEDFSTEYTRMWSLHPTYCENVSIKNLTIRSTGGNGDGIDIDSCKHVRIDACDIATGDDCI